MKCFVPDIYAKSVNNIDYDKLKEKGIRVLLFDFDNTIIEHKNYDLTDDIVKLFFNLKKSFKVYVVSNSMNFKKLSKLCSVLDVPYIGRSFKPLKFGYKRLKEDFLPSEIAMIGDQLITDVFGAHRMGYFSILVDPISFDKEIFFTKFNRYFEKKILEKNKIIRGDYYD